MLQNDTSSFMRRGGRGRFYICLIMLLLFPAGLLSDTVLLRNGRWLEGRLVRQTRRSVWIKVKGRTRRIAKSRIRRIRYGETRADKLKRIRFQKRLAREKARTDRDRREEVRLRRLLAEEVKRKKEEAERKKIAAELARQIALAEKKRKEALRTLEEAKRRIAALKKKTEPEKTGRKLRAGDSTGRLWRSAVLPGWGQFRAGRRMAGYLYGGGFLFMGLFTLQSRSAFVTAGQGDRTTAQTLTGSGLAGLGGANAGAAAFFMTQNSAASSQVAATRLARGSLILLGIYLFNLYDAYAYGPAPAATTGDTAVHSFLPQNNAIDGIVAASALRDTDIFSFRYTIRY